MVRYLALSLPTFSVDRVRQRIRCEAQADGAARVERDDLFLLTEETRGARWIVQCCSGSTELGVRPGMSLAHARALAGKRRSHVERFDPLRDQEGLEELCSLALRFSPHVTPWSSQGEANRGDRELGWGGSALVSGLLLDVSGSERLFKGEERLLGRVLAVFEARAYQVQGAIASTIGCAMGLARFGGGRAFRVAPGEEAAALGPLPTRALRIEEGVEDALAEVGIERVQDVYGLARAALPARFGSELLLRLDQALGGAFESFVPLRPKSTPYAARSFEAPVGIEVVTYTLREELAELSSQLVERGESALVLNIEIECAEAANIFEEVVLSRPHAGFEHFWSLIAPRLERMPLGFGAERVALSMSRTVPTVGRQVAAWGTRTEGGNASSEGRLGRALGRELAELVDHLAGRLGQGSVLGVEPIESHLPEDAFRTLACGAPIEGEAPAGQGGAQASNRGGRAGTGITTLPRPSRLFAPPEQVEVETGSGGEPLRLLGRGAPRQIVRRFGPERIAVPWWRGGSSPGDRDYFCVQDQAGRWLWLVLDVSGRWFLHGEWL